MNNADAEVAFDSLWTSFKNNRTELAYEYRRMNKSKKKRDIRQLVDLSHMLVAVDSKLYESSPKGL